MKDPICSDCGYEVVDTNDDRGEYYCNTCKAILPEEQVNREYYAA